MTRYVIFPVFESYHVSVCVGLRFGGAVFVWQEAAIAIFQQCSACWFGNTGLELCGVNLASMSGALVSVVEVDVVHCVEVDPVLY